MKSYSSTVDKAILIQETLDNSETVDWPLLRHYCVSQFGLVNDSLRVKVWPLLLGLNTSSDSYNPSSPISTQFEQQIEVDIARSLRNFDLLKGISTEERTHRAAQLTRIITQILCEDQQLHYFQGFHDICTVFLLVTDEAMALRLIHRFVNTHCRDAMRPSFDQISVWMGWIPEIIGTEDKDLSGKMMALQQDVTPTQIPMFALGWVITFFAHSIPRFQEVTRIYDFCIGTHPLGVLYLVAGVVLISRDKVMRMNELSDLHRYFSEAVKNTDWDVACEWADRLMQKLPPRLLAILKVKKEIAEVPQKPLSWRAKFRTRILSAIRHFSLVYT